MKPPQDKTIGIKNGQYDKMNEKGYVPEETQITNGDVIMGKVTPINDTTNSGKIFKDSSEQYKSHADGVVDRMYTGIKNQDGYETRKALIRSERFPHIGDKFCSRHGQTIFSSEILSITGGNGFVRIPRATNSRKCVHFVVLPSSRRDCRTGDLKSLSDNTWYGGDILHLKIVILSEQARMMKTVKVHSNGSDRRFVSLKDMGRDRLGHHPVRYYTGN